MRALTKVQWLASLALVATLVACGGKNEAQLIASAKTYLATGDAKAAIVELKTALQKNPNSGETRFLLGQALMDTADFADALVELKKARELQLDDPKLTAKLARAMLINGQVKALIDEMTGKTLSLPLAEAELHTALAVAQARSGNLLQAEAELARALKSQPKYPWGLQTMARLLAVKGQFDRAIELTDESMESGKPSGEAWLLRGDILLLGKQQGADALDAYRKALADPKHAKGAQLSIIRTHLAQLQFKEAKQEFESLRKNTPMNRQMQYIEAQIAYTDKNYGRAKEILQEMLRADSKNVQLLTFAGGVDLQRGAIAMAESQLSKVLLMAPEQATARKLLAQVLLQMGQTKRAHTVLRPLSELAQPDGDVLALEAAAYLQEGDVSKADALYGRAAKAKPADVNIRTSQALTELAKGRPDVAFDSLQKIAEADPGVTADMALISAHMRRNEYDAALKAISKLQQKEPGKATASYLRGVAHRLQKDRAAARVAFEEALSIEPAHFASTARLASMDLEDRKIDVARQRLEASLKLNPNNTAASLALAQVMRQQNSKAVDIAGVLNAAIRASPIEPEPHLALIAQLSTAGEVKPALSAAQAAVAVLPESVEILDAAGRAEANAGNDQQAIRTFSKIISLRPQAPLPYLRLAQIHESRKDTAAAALSLKRAFELAPNARDVQQRLIAFAVAGKNTKLALDAAKELQKRQPSAASGFVFEGDLLTASKDWLGALAAYKLALGKADSQQRVASSVFRSLVRAGQPAEADKFASGWLKSHPKDVAFMGHMGEVAMLRKDYATAERRFQDILAIDPKIVLALNNLAWLMAERGDKRSVDYAEAAVAQAPDEAPVLDTLAKALASTGQVDRAIEAQRQALALMPDRHPYRLTLARLYLKVGDKAKAAIELDALAALGAKFVYQEELSDLRKALTK